MYIKVNSYRFGLAWEKIEPTQGVFNEAAIAHYHYEIDQLLKNGIEPMITLHHFTEPLWFTDLGGFEKEANVAYMMPYVKRVYEEYGNKVKLWCTINEIEVFAIQGWGSGLFPPGKEGRYDLMGEVQKNCLITHMSMYKLIHQIADINKWKVQVGVVKDLWYFEPKNWWNPLDCIIAKVAEDGFNNAIMNFFKTGTYHFWFPFLANVKYTNLEGMKCNDFIGLNFYSHFHISAYHMIMNQKFINKDARPEDIFLSGCENSETPTDMPQSVYAEGFYRAIMACHELNIPIFITENGIADAVDDRRELFIKKYLYAMTRAMKDGADVKGYYYWSLLDNFEWALGYDMRFGLVHVDYKTQKRTIRNSAKYFASVADKFGFTPRGDKVGKKN
jgi:beta-glucosidase